MVSQDSIVKYLESKLQKAGYASRREVDEGIEVLRIVTQLGDVIGGIAIPGVSGLSEEQALGAADALYAESMKAAAKEPIFRGRNAA